MNVASPSQARFADAPCGGEAPASSPEAALRQSERRLAYVMRLAQLADWEYDVASGCFTFNAGCYALLGTTVEREGGERMPAKVFTQTFMHPDDAHLVAEEILKAVAATDPDHRSQFEFRVIRRDREVRHLVVDVGISRSVREQAVELYGAVQDITDRKKSEWELRKLWRAVEQTPATVVITDVCGNIEYANPKFVEVTGYSVAEALGQNPRILNSGRHPRDFYRAMWEALQQGNIWQGEMCNKKKNGELFWESASISPVRDENGTTTHFVAIKEDITERKRAAEALKCAEQQLLEYARQQQVILDNISDPAWLRDREGRFLVVNRAWCEFAGISVGQAVGKTIAEVKIYPAEMAASLQEEDELVMSSGKPSQNEMQLPHARLGTVWFETSKSPLLDEQRKVYGLAGIARDITARKQAECEMFESERFLQSTLDALSAHIAILDERGVIIEVNSVWREFARRNRFLGSDYGVGADYLRLCDSAVGDCAHEAPAVAQGIRAVMAGQCGEFQLEYPCHSPQEQRWFVVRVTRFSGEGPVRVVIAHENITMRKRAEEELQRKTAFLEAQVNSSIDGILVVDELGRKILQNQRMTDLLGIPQAIADSTDDELQLKWVAQMTKNPGLFLEKVHRLNAHPEEVGRDEMEMKDGPILDRYSAPLIGRDGKYYGRLWTFCDITERKRADAVLREKLVLREWLAKIAVNAPGIIYTFRLRPDGTTCLPYVSPTIEEFYGVRAEDLVEDASPIFDLMHPADQARVRESIAASARTLSPWRDEFRVRHPKKGLFWVEGQSTPEREADGGTLWHGFMSDITARRLVAEQLQLAKEAADSANRAKSEFLAVMSHEIRTPMNGLLGFASLLLDTPLSEEQHQFAQTIHLSGQTLLRLINDILDFSKIEAGKLTLESIRFALPPVVQEVADLLAIQAKQKELSLRVQCQPPLPPQLTGDPGRVRQVLLNLAGNAIKFTRHGGVTLTVKLDPARPQFVRCEITDTGIGIAPEKQAGLFKLFSQADSSITRQFGGTGLGLAISKRLVELMGGQIGLTSEANQGSTFWFTLPTGLPRPAGAPGQEPAAPAAGRAESPAGPSAPPATRLRILLAEDNYINQKLVVHLLKKISCDVDVAVNGKEAVAMAAGRSHDAIFMDCLMPEMDGLEATRQIRHAENGGGRVPIIAITACVGEDQRELCLAAGMDDFIQKPIHNGDLERALQKWVPSTESRQSGEPTSNKNGYENVDH